MTRVRALLLIPALLLGACAQPPVTPAAEAPPALPPLDVNRDYHSYANTADFVTEHLRLDLAVDFTRRVLDGTVELRLPSAWNR